MKHTFPQYQQTSAYALGAAMLLTGLLILMGACSRAAPDCVSDAICAGKEGRLCSADGNHIVECVSHSSGKCFKASKSWCGNGSACQMIADAPVCKEVVRETTFRCVGVLHPQKSLPAAFVPRASFLPLIDGKVTTVVRIKGYYDPKSKFSVALRLSGKQVPLKIVDSKETKHDGIVYVQRTVEVPPSLAQKGADLVTIIESEGVRAALIQNGPFRVGGSGLESRGGCN